MEELIHEFCSMRDKDQRKPEYFERKIKAIYQYLQRSENRIKELEGQIKKIPDIKKIEDRIKSIESISEEMFNESLKSFKNKNKEISDIKHHINSLDKDFESFLSSYREYNEYLEKRFKSLEDKTVKNKQLIDGLKKVIDCQSELNDEIIDSVLQLSQDGKRGKESADVLSKITFPLTAPFDIKDGDTVVLNLSNGEITRPAPPKKYKYVVKSKPELLKWFEENGYNKSKFDESLYDYTREKELAFDQLMFAYCGDEIKNIEKDERGYIKFKSFLWLPEWLNKIPVDEPSVETLSREEWDGIKRRLKESCNSIKCEGCVINKNNNCDFFTDYPMYWDID